MDTKSFYDLIWRGITSPLAKTGGGPLDITVDAYPYPSDYYVGEGPGPFGPPHYAAGVAQNAPPSIPPRGPLVDASGMRGNPALPAPVMDAGKPAGAVAAPPPPGAPASAGTPQALPGIPSGSLPDLANFLNGGSAPQQGGFLDFLQQPGISDALMQAGLGMLQASMPSTNPASGSLGAVLGGGLGGFQQGMEAAREAERQAREDAINEAYKMAIMQSDPNKAPTIVKDGAGKTYVWNAEKGQFDLFGDAPPVKGSGGSSGQPTDVPTGWNLPTPVAKEVAPLLESAQTASRMSSLVTELIPLVEAGKIPANGAEMTLYRAWKDKPELVAPEFAEKFNNFAKIERQILGARDAILSAATGPQTDDDARRALDRVANAMSDPAALAAALRELAATMDFTSATARKQIDFYFANEGRVVPDDFYGSSAPSAAPDPLGLRE